ncbi:unnamed protein product [Cuscuta campestris]|uniref:Uncharacterized protein n=1 Tax=Cuscuta campestris TaxID=132261 RepID=A0A484KUN1_9ASTE|nr:unnamed protein product [Cuscuta campestris]
MVGMYGERDLRWKARVKRIGRLRIGERRRINGLEELGKGDSGGTQTSGGGRRRERSEIPVVQSEIAVQIVPPSAADSSRCRRRGVVTQPAVAEGAMRLLSETAAADERSRWVGICRCRGGIAAASPSRSPPPIAARRRSRRRYRLQLQSRRVEKSPRQERTPGVANAVRDTAAAGLRSRRADAAGPLPSSPSCPIEAADRRGCFFFERTSIPAVGTSPENFLLSMESVCSQDVPGSGSVRLQWEPVGTEDESGADFAVTDVLELGRASTGLSVV